MGAGGVIHQRRNAIKTAVNDSSIFDSLPQHCKDKVADINAKNVDDWTEGEESVMAGMIAVAVHS